MSQSTHSAIFLDRDGTIIQDTHYIRDPQLVALLPQAAEGLREMRRRGYLLFVISNQSGVGRGIIAQEQFHAVHERFCGFLAQEGITIDGFLYCFHHPDESCGCRKPKAGLIPRAFGGRELNWGASFTVGDKECDLELADSIGGKGYLVLTGQGRETLERLTALGLQDRYPIRESLVDVAHALPRVT